MRQGGDPHALTCNRIRHHGGGGMTHGDARQRLGHGHSDRCHRHRHLCHGNRRGHPLSDGLCQGS